MTTTASRTDIISSIMGPPSDPASAIRKPAHTFATAKMRHPSVHVQIDATGIITSSSFRNSVSMKAVAQLTTFTKDEQVEQTKLLEVVSSPPPLSPPSSISSDSGSDSSENSSPTSVNGKQDPPPLLPELVPALKKSSVVEICEDWRPLCDNLSRFFSANTHQKGDILRWNILPFLRKYASRSMPRHDVDRKRGLLYKWWVTILRTLEGIPMTATASMPVSDILACIEAIASIADRPEWRQLDTESPSYLEYQLVLFDTLSYIHGLMLRKHPPAWMYRWFARIVTICFFNLKDFAPVLLKAFRIKSSYLNELYEPVQASRLNSSDSKYEDSLFQSFPAHLRNISDDIFTKSSELCIPTFDVGYGRKPLVFSRAWLKAWSFEHHSLFFHFLGCYHSFVASRVPFQLPGKTIYRLPGYLHFHAHLAAICVTAIQPPEHRRHSVTDHLHRRPGPHTPPVNSRLSSDFTRLRGLNDTQDALRHLEDSLQSLLQQTTSCRQQQLRLLYTLEHVLLIIAKQANIYEVRACFSMCALAETWFHVLNSYGHQLKFKPWIEVCQRYIESGQTLPTVRIITFLFAVWPLLSKADAKYASIEWILCPKIFFRLFLDWSPMVRAYFHRFVCWRLVKIEEDECLWKADVLFQLRHLMKFCFEEYTSYREDCLTSGRQPPSILPCTPTPSRRLVIALYKGQSRRVNQPTSEVTPEGPSDSMLPQLYAGVNAVSTSVTSSVKRAWSLLRSTLVPSQGAGEAMISGNGYITDSISKPTVNELDFADTDKPLRKPPMYKFIYTTCRSTPSCYFTVSPRSYKELLQHFSQIQLPYQANCYLYTSNHIVGHPPMDKMNLPKGFSVYTGRALVEWALVVQEFDDFYTQYRAKNMSDFVETPDLTI
ncbi:fungal family protein [Schizosaccharomyces japonicus yFS275]|uniref:Fungal family protein n=1 Tax=Schizosaccharomyces japonicus (strain yFS275 / FY16936) TaxID=402676 RepID=B6K702_SCHJY|nr:fungal family protein [Schizosaccharomyces japonicus yFS275]EEB09306.1 fungal family protein [Schizosaccharomyces japonicus yFS275]